MGYDMLKFLSLYIGNEKEAFCESRFDDGINIIYSDDNNKGKTIVLQGLYYALGKHHECLYIHFL